jgi:hypothetical protein
MYKVINQDKSLVQEFPTLHEAAHYFVDNFHTKDYLAMVRWDGQYMVQTVKEPGGMYTIFPLWRITRRLEEGKAKSWLLDYLLVAADDCRPSRQGLRSDWTDDDGEIAGDEHQQERWDRCDIDRRRW